MTDCENSKALILTVDPLTLDVFFPMGYEGYYHAICLYNGVVDDLCPNNHNSLCRTSLHERPRELYHDWDGRNAWKCPCCPSLIGQFRGIAREC